MADTLTSVQYKLRRHVSSNKQLGKKCEAGNRSCFLLKALLTQLTITYEQGYTRRLLNKVLEEQKIHIWHEKTIWMVPGRVKRRDRRNKHNEGIYVFFFLHYILLSSTKASISLITWLWNSLRKYGSTLKVKRITITPRIISSIINCKYASMVGKGQRDWKT